MNPFAGRFAGQTAVITGGGSGIGLALAQRLTVEGAKVSAWDISESALNAGSASFAHSVVVDQSDEKAVERATALTLQAFAASKYWW